MGLVESLTQSVVTQVVRAAEALPTTSQSTLSIDSAEIAQSLGREMLDLRMPTALREWLTAPLQSLGFSIEKIEVPGRFGSATRTYDVIKNRAGQCSVFHIRKQVLEVGSSWEALGNAIIATQLKKQILLIMSEGLDAAHVAYTVVLDSLWEDDLKIRASFVPWRHLQEIKDSAKTDQLTYLPKVLKLNELMAAALETSSDSGEEADLLRVATIIATVPRFIENSEEQWRLLFEAAGLKSLILDFQEKIKTREGGIAILSTLRKYAPLASHPNDSVLGLLLVAVTQIKEIPTEDAKFVQVVATRYSLTPK
jgi:hypothetical protein